MSEQELAGAAGRYRVGIDAYRSTNGTDVTGWIAQRRMDGDARELALAYLAEHPADDGEPVTAEWLRSVGFTAEPGNDTEFNGPPCSVFGYPTFGIDVTPSGEWWANRLHADGWEDESSMCRVPTRGQVRRLCGVLGVPLMVGSPS